METRTGWSILLAFALLAAGCATVGPAPLADRAADIRDEAATVALPDDLEVLPLAEGVWLHGSTEELPGFGRVLANGLVVEGEAGALLVDTPWTPAQTQALLRWIEAELGLQVTDVVLTHAHRDSTGGVAALPATARIHALAATRSLAARAGRPFTAAPLAEEAAIPFAGARVETFFPGPGHAPDNLVVWLPERRLLFGGCFVKSLDARDLGNLEDADLEGWARSIRRALEGYGRAAVVVPGHGEVGGAELLEHTQRLVDDALDPPPEAP